jgi:Polyketide cyclase / dehydrase and lipid transport
MQSGYISSRVIDFGPVARIVVDKTLNAPIEHVFELVSDHAAYAENFKFAKSSELTCEGSPDPNGLGAVRRIATGPIRFSEEITAFERPVRMDYLITSVNAPITHQGGSIRLEPVGDATHVVWTSEFTATTPVVGKPMEAVLRAVFARGFAGMLDEAEALYAPDPVPVPSS